MKAIIAEHGWPGARLVQRDGAEAAWLLIQHADQDVAFQRQALALLEAATARGEASKSNVAYLTDRVLTNEPAPEDAGYSHKARRCGLPPRKNLTDTLPSASASSAMPRPAAIRCSRCRNVVQLVALV